MKKKKSYTIRDIAENAGVSPATVSLVLNGKGEISGETRARVLESVSRLNYVPRAAKMGTSAGETIRFLKIAKHGETVNRDHSVFISDYIDGMSSEATRRNYTLEVVSFEGQPMSAVAESLAGASIRGVIALGTELSVADIHMIQGIGLPTVFIDTFYEVVEANFVDMNNEDAVFKVLSRFKQLGLSRIGFVASHTETTNFRLRRDAFFKNMQRLELTVQERDILSVESTYEGAHRDTCAMLHSGLDLAEAYFCTNDIIAYGFIRALKAKGIRIPDDVSVIGFDNLPQSATMEPGLTTVEVSKRKIGNLAVTVLDDLISTSDSQPPVKILVGADIVSRASDSELSSRKNRLTKVADVVQ
ncbi:LacI family DNA-binding transcriptional regulator [Brucella pseudogrignonensis]|uniref:LacI family transcriptional regulator n=1 Tax=Brucella pseudogrignonensis TaxID=419475 RepID=A0ABU1M9P8_9HYPH|nr:LacI family DNA-binding transcriptional regulator [Brucella pseudogrignonensis]MDR6432426.1 LacI family transcriptional regulator [Brucella pseudogrignonensis]